MSHPGFVSKIIKILIFQSGAMIDCLNSMQETPLYLAAENNHVEIIEELIGRGADINKW